MKTPDELFTVALGLAVPWRVSEVRFEPERGEIHFEVRCEAKRLPCPVCGAQDQPIHDRQARTWQHLHFFQYRAYLHAELPRVACAGCGKTTQVAVPWARERSGFTLLFEALALTLARAMPMRQVARLPGCGQGRLWRALGALVDGARAEESFAEVRRIGVDEKHIGRSGYVSFFHDAERRRMLLGCPGREGAVFEAFVTDLEAHHGDAKAITAVAMDLSQAYQAGARAELPQAALCFDRFHVVKLGHQALDEVRRAEVKTVPELKGIRWGTLKDAEAWTENPLIDMHWLSHSRLKTARAWRLKEALREVLARAAAGEPPEPLLKGWVSWARRSRLAPFKRLGATVRDHLEGIANSFRLGLSNGTAESLNATVQMAISRARGFRTLENLLTIVYLMTGKLSHLPAPPYSTAAASRA